MRLFTSFGRDSRWFSVLLGGLCFLLLFSQVISDLPGGNAEEASEIEKIRIIAERFSFTPSRIKLKEGERVEFELVSEDTFHGFRIPAANLEATIPARGRGVLTVLFNANKKGAYPFECSRPCGAGHTMMRGIIIVE